VESMRIYTSYYANLRNIPEDIVPISISLKPPEWYKGLEYKKLAPTEAIHNEWLRNHNYLIYTSRYIKEVLKFLDIDNVIHDLSNLSGGKDVVLVCYEAPDKFCHRKPVADWLIIKDNHVIEFNNKKESKK
jgi:hypothetical protein